MHNHFKNKAGSLVAPSSSDGGDTTSFVPAVFIMKDHSRDIGKVYNGIEVLEYRYSKNTERQFMLKCHCGKLFISSLRKIKSGNTKSCGCKKYPCDRMGLSSSKLYKVWHSMIRRCYCEKSKDYKSYGRRGIDVCEEWKNSFISFYNWSKNNGYSEGLELDRIKNHLGYSPDNCQYITKEQNLKKRVRKRLPRCIFKICLN